MVSRRFFVARFDVAASLGFWRYLSAPALPGAELRPSRKRESVESRAWLAEEFERVVFAEEAFDGGLNFGVTLGEEVQDTRNLTSRNWLSVGVVGG